MPNNNKRLPIRFISLKSTNSEKAFRFMIWTFHSCHNKPVPPASPHEASFTAIIRSKRSVTAQSFRVALIREKDKITRTCLFGWDEGDLIENASRGDEILPEMKINHTWHPLVAAAEVHVDPRCVTFQSLSPQMSSSFCCPGMIEHFSSQ